MNLSERTAEKYYTPQEAMNRLGMTRDMFNHHVKQGSIKKYIFVGKHGYYSKVEIEAMREKIEYTLLTVNETDLTYRAALPADLEDLNRVAHLNFGELSRSPERIAARKRILEANPSSTFVLYNYNALVAALDIVPLKHEAILQFREGVRGWTFPNKMIEQFEPGHRLECIIIDFMTTTNAPKARREYYASVLLRQFGSQTLTEWGRKGVDIQSVDACGGFEDGRHILGSAGFVSIGIKKHNREIYTLDLDHSKLRTLQPYKEALQDWKAHNN